MSPDCTECFCVGEDDSDSFEDRIEAFVSDRFVGALTGVRRYGRDNLVETVVERLRSKGIAVSLIPGAPVDDPEVIAFRHWKDIDEDLVDRYPDADVLYGQDLCHQVPAVVRVVKAPRFRTSGV